MNSPRVTGWNEPGWADGWDSLTVGPDGSLGARIPLCAPAAALGGPVPLACSCSPDLGPCLVSVYRVSAVHPHGGSEGDTVEVSSGLMEISL